VKANAFVAIVGAMTLLVVAKTAIDQRPVPETLPPATFGVGQPQITDRNGAPLSVTYQADWNLQDVVPLHETPELLQQAFVHAEDKRFFEHNGVDWLARAHALVQNVRALRAVRGASTITEQVVRILHPRRRTMWSRWLEGIEAARLEERFSKDQILAVYLNQVPYARQRRGVAQAARDYFGRDLDTLTDKELLALAVLPRSPSRLDLIKGVELIEPPLRRLAKRLHARGVMDRARLEAIERERLTVVRVSSPLDAAHFVRFVRDHAHHAEAHRIKTTLDGSLQRRVQQLLDRQVENLASRRVGDGAALAVDHRTNEVLAWVNAGGLSDREGGHIDKVTTPRQPGSALKPFAYALALERGWTAATLIDDAPLVESVGHGVHNFRNYSRHYYGPIRLREALGNSLNVPAVLAAQFTGRSELLERLRLLGFDSLTQHPDFYGDGLALGNGEVTLFEMVQAYATLARGGEFRDLEWRFDNFGSRGREVFSPEVASVIARILSDPDARRREFGVGSVLNLPVQTAVKTGTSNDYRDAWALGFSDRYTVGVWMGNVDQRPMQEVTGSLGPALVLRAIFAELRRHKESRSLFLSRKLVPRHICTKTGELATDRCPIAPEWFRPDRVPVTKCTAHTDHQRYARKAPESAVRLESPTPGLHIALDPRIPDELERFAFRISADGAQRVEWILDEEVIATTQAAEPAFLWHPTRGTHTAQARVWTAGQPRETDPVSFIVK
jgi:penicillin-binding protein 1C